MSTKAETGHLAKAEPDTTGLDLRTDAERRAAAAAARKAQAAAARDAAAAERELAREQRDAERALEEFNNTRADALTRLEDLRAELEGPSAQVTLEYSRLEADLANLMGIGALTVAEYAEGMELLFQARQKALAGLAKDTKEVTDSMSVYADQAARNMQSAFADFLFDPFEDGLSGMLQSFADTLQRMYAEYLASEIFRAFMGGMDSSGNNWGSIFDLFSGGSGFGFAKGGAVPASPSISAYSGSVVSQPTPFYFAKGAALGVMGEVPGESEGIFPLKRGRDGKLGVSADLSGLGGGGTVVEIHNYSPEPARGERGTRPDGTEFVRVIIGTVQQGFNQGAFDGNMSMFGVRRQGVSSG